MNTRAWKPDVVAAAANRVGLVGSTRYDDKKKGRTVTRVNPLLLCILAAWVSPALAENQIVSRVGYQYDELGRVIRQLDADGQTVVSYTYDNNGNRLSSTDTQNRTTWYGYDSLDRLDHVTDAKGGNTWYAYDAADRLVQLTDPRQLATHYNYDGFGQLWSQGSPDTGTTTFQYDSSGLMRKMTRNDGSSLNYEYDGLGRLTSAGDGVESRVYGYDWCELGKGRLCNADGPGSIVHFSYIAQGEVATKRQLWGGNDDWTVYRRDALGRITGVTYPGSLFVSYEYGRDRLNAIRANFPGEQVATVVSDIRYQPFGAIVGWKYGNGLERNYNFDLNGLVSGISAGDNQGVAQSLTIGRDSEGLINAITNGVTGSMSQTYAYDALGRLTTVRGNQADEDLSYDPSGNRAQHDWWMRELGYKAQAPYAIDPQSNRVNGEHITYQHDGRGNRLSQTWDNSTATYRYDAFNFLREVSRDVAQQYMNPGTGTRAYPAGTTRYVTNALDQRISKSGPGGDVRFAFDIDGHLLEERKADGVKGFIWLGAELVGVVQPNKLLNFVHGDQLSRPEVVTDWNRQAVWRANNYAFERSIVLDSIGGLNVGFPGQYFDAESGLWHNGYRYYDGRIGRYTQSDPIGLDAGINTYLYTLGDPINAIDPSGLGSIGPGIDVGPGNGTETPTPDYVTVNVSVPSLFSFGYTLTRNGIYYGFGGLAMGNPKGMPNAKLGFSLSAGYILKCERIDDLPEQFIEGGAWGVSYYRGIGGGVVHNSTGTAVEAGIGFGGGGAGYTYSGRITPVVRKAK